jgi:DNA polymerase
VGSDRPQRLDELKAAILECPNYRALIQTGSLRDIMVFATGNPHSPLMFIGEAPGAEEERRGEPFVGPAGQLLNRIIHAMGLERRRVYISNIVKFRPAIPGGSQGEKNRKPEAAEMAAGRPHLIREIGIIRPRIIVALGGSAMEGLFCEPCAITRVRGKWRDLDGIPVMPTFHPSYLLRNADPAERRKLWEDMLEVMAVLGLPITENQRRFFLPGQ